MPYQRTTWENREVEKPRTYTFTDNGDGTTTLTPAEGNILSAGTPITSQNMNNIEEYLSLLSSFSEIVETSTTSNGTYVRWANGYQACYGLWSVTMTTGVNGALHSASLPTVTLPANFLNSNYAIVTTPHFSQAVGMDIISTTTSSFSPRVFTISALSASFSKFTFFAFGRWSA